jgi:hypothetical protein
MVHYCGSPPIPDVPVISREVTWCKAFRLLQTRCRQSHDAEDDRSERGSKQPQKQAQLGASGRFWFVPAKILVQVIVWFVVSQKRSFLPDQKRMSAQVV